MIHIYLDTALLAVPNYAYGANSENVQELLDRVFHFSDLLTADLPLTLVVAEEVESTLGVDYPTHESIREFLADANLAHVFSVNDLYQQYLTVLDRATRPCELGSFEVHSISSFDSMPPLPPGLAPAVLLVETERCVTNVAVQVDGDTAWWLGSSMNDDGNRRLAVTATVDAASHDPSPNDGPLAFTFARPANVLVNFAQLAELDTARELWRLGSSSDDLHLAVSLGALAMRRGMFPHASFADLKTFSIGSDFFASLEPHQCGRGQNFSNTTFELCAQIVADIGIAAFHEMGAPQQERRAADNAGAFRSQITTGNPALRLMFWETQEGIEFANVGNKKDLEIEPGDIASSVRVDLSNVL